MILVTLGASLFTGYFGGLIARANFMGPPEVLFKDDDHVHDVASRYPKEYKEE